MAAIKIGDMCPAYDWNKCEKIQCDYCKHFNAYCINKNNEEIVDCKYSKIPTVEPKFNKGDLVWYLDYGEFPTNEKVRKAEWDGSKWMYYCGRKQTAYEVFGTNEECRKSLAKHMAKKALQQLQEAVKYAGGLNNLKQLMDVNDLKLLKLE